MKSLSLVLFLFSLPALAALPRVDKLEVPRDFDTPACSVETQEGQVIFAVPHGASPMMRLNGRLVKFRLAPGAKSLWDYQTKGEMIRTRYLRGNLTLTLLGRVSDACEAHEEGCEATDLALEAILSDGQGARRFSRLLGSCGV
jgi:hypothetical protein